MQSFSMWKYPDRNTIVFNFQDFKMTLLPLWPLSMVQPENTRGQAFSNWLFPMVIPDLNPGIIKELRKLLKPTAATKKRNLHEIPFIRKLRPFGRFVYVNSLPHGILSP